ncbi:hypothetical protein JCM3774_002103 [Rhodotorula dairenensis]
MGLNPPAPELAILSNEAALHSLKRPQLLALCKQNGLKGSGKNLDLIARLVDRGRFLATCEVAEDSNEAGDESTASWAVLPAETAGTSASGTGIGAEPAPSDTGMAGSPESSPRASSTLQTAQDASEPAARPATTSIYPSLSALQGIAVSSKEPLLAPADVANSSLGSQTSLPPRPATAESESSYGKAPPFVFGSPVKDARATNAFSFTMPGTLSLSTISATMDEAHQRRDTTAIDAVMEEMTRRAAQARAAAETSGIHRSNSSTLLSSLPGDASHEPAKGKKADFDSSHRRTFDKMDSITNHWAAKRSIHSSMDLAGMTRSDHEEAEPQAKRPRPISLQQSSQASVRDNKIVAALRESGWSTSAERGTAVSLSGTVRNGIASLARSLKDTKSGEPAATVSAQARRKRQLELAKARRKSGVSSSVGLAKRRPSLGVGPKPRAIPPVPQLNIRQVSGAPPSHAQAGAAQADVQSKIADRPTPRFAAPTASTSTRAALTAAASPSVHRSGISPKKPTARKHFDLQASLKRPMLWRTHLRSPATTTPIPQKAGLGEDSSLGADGATATSLTRNAAFGRLLALPQAPTSPFTAPALAGESPAPSPSAVASGSHVPLTWQPPAVTKGPLMPATPKPAKPPGPSTLEPSAVKKTVSAASRSMRGAEKATAKKRLEGLDSHARMVRAKAAAAKARVKPT